MYLLVSYYLSRCMINILFDQHKTYVFSKYLKNIHSLMVKYTYIISMHIPENICYDRYIFYHSHFMSVFVHVALTYCPKQASFFNLPLFFSVLHSSLPLTPTHVLFQRLVSEITFPKNKYKRSNFSFSF